METEFKVGDKVYHRSLKEYGTITMLGEDHCGSNFSMIVHFESLGEELEVSTSLLNKMKNIYYSYYILKDVLLKMPEQYAVMFDDDDCDETYVTFDIDDQALFGSYDVRTVKDLLGELCHVNVEKLLGNVTCNYGTYILYSVSVKENTVWLKMVPLDPVL